MSISCLLMTKNQYNSNYFLKSKWIICLEVQSRKAPKKNKNNIYLGYN